MNCRKNVQKPQRACGDCIHVHACSAWNVGSLIWADASSCANYDHADSRDWDIFQLITSVAYGKQRFFREDDGRVWDRESGEYMTFEVALDKYLGEIGDSGDY